MKSGPFLALIGIALAIQGASPQHRSQQPPATCAKDSLWLAGRVDAGTADPVRIVIYFDTVHFGKWPSGLRAIQPKAAGFMGFSVLPTEYVDSLVPPSRRVFHRGDRFELLTGNGSPTPITLTDLVGFLGDEDVGNVSYVGAMATVPASALQSVTRNNYVVRPAGAHATASVAGSRIVRVDVPKATQAVIVAQLQALAARGDANAPVFEGPMADMMAEFRLETQVKAQSDAQHDSLTIDDITAFRLADGQLRYYVRARFAPGDECSTMYSAFVTPTPSLHVVAADVRRCESDMGKEMEQLLNVVDLGNGEAALVTHMFGGDGFGMDLWKFRDGASLFQMCHVQGVSQGE